MKRSLIINADDFGQSDAITDGICQGARAGAITSTTLLCNCGRSSLRALELARDIPQLGVGVHLNLTEGRPLADPALVYRLVGIDWHFKHRPFGLLARAAASRQFCAEVLIEWSAQIEWFLAHGGRPTHLDSHKHVHAAPQLFEIACMLAEEYHIPFVRLVSERPWRGPLARPAPPLKRFRRARQCLVASALRVGFSKRARCCLQRRGLQSADHFFGVADTGGWNAELLERFLGRLPVGISELMVHPGLPGERHDPGRLARSRPLELAALLEADLPNLAACAGVRLTNYVAETTTVNQEAGHLSP